MKKSVAVLLQAYTTGKSGGDIACIRILQRLPIHQYILHVFSSQKGIALCKQEKFKAIFHTTSSERNITFILFTYIQRVITFCRFKHPRYTAIYCSSDALPDVISALWLRTHQPNIPWIQKMYHIVPVSRLLSWLMQHISLFFIKKYSTKIIVASVEMKQKLREQRIDSSKILVNYLGTEKPVIMKNAKTKKYEAVYIGRFHQSKGIYDLIPIWSFIVKQFPSAHLTIIGTGDRVLVEMLQKLIHEKNLDTNITLTGYLDDKKTWTIAQESGTLLLPSYEEGFSLTITSALSYHMSVVAYTLPIYTELFQNIVVTVKKGDHISFARAIIKIWKTRKTQFIFPEKRFSWETAAKTEMVYL